MIHRALTLLLALNMTACVSVSYPHADELLRGEAVPSDVAQDHGEKRAKLARAIGSLGDGIDMREAESVAELAILLPQTFAEQYGLTKPPIAHNVLVNSRLRPRGLCIHWAEDLLVALQALNLATLDLHWGVAYPLRPWRLEHSSVVVTARDRPFESGIVLDGWRNSGRLYWTRVPDDERYRWERLATVFTDP